MSSGDQLDLIRELRLRQWARTHYVPVAERGRGWHPIVLDEMRRKDAEQPIQPVLMPVRSSFVPLPPTTVHALHAAHSDIPAPKLLQHQSCVGELVFG